MEDEREGGKSKWGNNYLIKVLKSLGIMHLIVFVMMILCDVIVLLPAHIKWSIDMTSKLINILSNGNEDYKAFFWAFLIATLITLVVIWIISKVLEYRRIKKERAGYSLTQEQ